MRSSPGLLALCGALLLAGCSLLLPLPLDYGDGDGDGDADGAIEAGPDADADVDVDADVDADTDTDTDADTDVDADADGDVDTDVDADIDGDADADVDADAEGPEDSGPPCVGSGHDEDGDGLDDECDICPTYYDPDQLDGDGDGLGDRCEEPGQEGMLDHIARFDPFVGYTGAGYSGGAGGSWSASGDGDGLYVTTSGDTNLYSSTSATEPYAVEATFDSTSNSYDGWVGVLFAARDIGSSPLWWMCAWDAESRHVQLWRYDGGRDVMRVGTEPTGSSERLGASRRLRAAYDPRVGLSCTIQIGGGAATTSIAAREAWPDMSGTTGLRAYALSTVFRSFIVYQ